MRTKVTYDNRTPVRKVVRRVRRRIDGEHDVHAARLHEQRLHGHDLAVLAAVDEREQRLVRVRKGVRRAPEEGVRQRDGVEPDVRLREGGVQRGDDGPDFGGGEGGCLWGRAG